MIDLRIWVVFCLFLFGVCSELNAESIKVGAIYPLTGAASYIGEGSRIGAIIAQDLINESGGINGKNLELVIEDSQSEPRAGLSAFTKLTESDKVPVVMVSLTSISMALRPLAEERKVLLLAQSTHPDLVKGFNYILRDFFTVDVANDLVIRFLEKSKNTQLGVLHSEDEFAQAALSDLQKKAEQGRFKVSVHESFPRGASDLRAQLLRIRSATPEVLYVIGIGPSVISAIKQIRELHLPQKFIGHVVCGQGNIFEAAKDVLEGGFSVELSVDRHGREYQDLEARYLQVYPTRKIDQQVITAFDTVNVIAQALKQSAYSGSALREFIVGHGSFSGAFGKVEFSKSGDSRRAMELVQIKGGQCQPFVLD